MREGKITKELSGAAITEENIARFAIKDTETV
jgi:ribose transport system ATP-binding protein